MTPTRRSSRRWYTERAVKFIDENKDRPFFLYVAAQHAARAAARLRQVQGQVRARPVTAT